MMEGHLSGDEQRVEEVEEQEQEEEECFPHTEVTKKQPFNDNYSDSNNDDVDSEHKDRDSDVVTSRRKLLDFVRKRSAVELWFRNVSVRIPLSSPFLSISSFSSLCCCCSCFNTSRNSTNLPNNNNNNNNNNQQNNNDDGAAKVLLFPISGRLKSGELVAIMGPTGSGKSTLLSTLSGIVTSKRLVTEGEILLRRKEEALFELQDCSLLESGIGSLLPQEDLMIPELTVREQLSFSANFLSSKQRPIEEEEEEKETESSSSSTVNSRRIGTKRRRKKDLIQVLLEISGLSSVAESRIRGISGGERRKLAILCDAVLSPGSIMLLDEPTSGLSSQEAVSVVQLLRFLADELSYTIALTIHQPSQDAFLLFDSLIVLRKGHCVHQGSPKTLLHDLSLRGVHLPPFPSDVPSSSSPSFPLPSLSSPPSCSTPISSSDTLLDIIDSLPIVTTNSNQPQQSEQHNVIDKTKEKRKGKESGLWIAVRTLLIQHYCRVSRKHDLMISPAVLLFLYSILNGLTFSNLRFKAEDIQDRFNIIYNMHVALIPQAVGWVCLLFEEKARTRRDLLLSRYNVFSSISAWALITFLHCLLLSIVNYSAAYWLIGFSADFGTWCLFVFMAAMVTYSMLLVGMMLVVHSSSVSVAVGYLLIVLFPISELTAFYASRENLSVVVRYLVYANFNFYALEGLSWTEFGSRRFSCSTRDQQELGLKCGSDGFVLGEQFLKDRSFKDQLGLDVAVVCSWAIFLTLCYGLLSYSMRPKFASLRHPSFSSGLGLRGQQPRELITIEREEEEEYDDHVMDRLQRKGSGLGPKFLSQLKGTLLMRSGFMKSKNHCRIAFQDMSVTSYHSITTAFWTFLITPSSWFSKRKARTRTKVLRHVSGHIETGELVAILGSTGSGKSTLLKSLAGVKESDCLHEGSILVNGTLVSRTLLSQHLLALVTQHDCLLPELTVHESLEFAAAFQLSDLSVPMRREFVKETLSLLQLWKVRHQRIGSIDSRGISGGQRKKLSIAADALMSTAPIILLDEPTTGLSSKEANELISFLWGLTRKFNYGALVAIHQPRTSILELFDRIVVMSGGEIVLTTTPSEIPNLLSQAGIDLSGPNQNLAELLLTHLKPILSVHSSNVSAEMSTLTSQEGEAKLRSNAFSPSLPDSSFSSSSPLTRRLTREGQKFFLLLRMLFLLHFRGAVFLELFLQSVAVGVAYGIIYLQFTLQADSAFQLLGILETLGTTFFLLLESHSIARFSRREKENRDLLYRRYSLLSLLLGDTLIMFLSITLVAIPFVTVAYWMIGFRASGESFMVFLTGYVVFSWTMDTAWKCFYYLLETPPSVSAAYTTLVFLGTLWNGFWRDLDRIPSYFRWLSDINISKYFLELLFGSQLRNRKIECEDNREDKKTALEFCPLLGNQILKALGYKDAPERDFGFALGCIAFLLLVCILIVQFKAAWKHLLEEWRRRGRRRRGS